MDKNKKLYIKIPVYISQETKVEKGNLFQTNIDSLINDAKSLISSFNSGPQGPLMINRRAKTTAIGINKIDPIDLNFNSDICLLLKVTAYKTNLIDGYYQSGRATGNEIRFSINDKLCSDTYFFVLYPQIEYSHDDKYYYWHVFIYEDPSKESSDMISIARRIMKDIMKIPIRNIKSDKLLSELKKYDLVSQVEITLSSISNDDEDVPYYLSNYKYSNKLKKERKIRLENMTKEDAISTFEDEEFVKIYSKRQVKFIMQNKRTLSLIQEFSDKLSSTLEDSFNYTVEVDPKDINNIFEIESIKKNVGGIFTQYIYASQHG